MVVGGWGVIFELCEAVVRACVLVWRRARSPVLAMTSSRERPPRATSVMALSAAPGLLRRGVAYGMAWMGGHTFVASGLGGFVVGVVELSSSDYVGPQPVFARLVRVGRRTRGG